MGGHGRHGTPQRQEAAAEATPRRAAWIARKLKRSVLVCAQSKQAAENRLKGIEKAESSHPSKPKPT